LATAASFPTLRAFQPLGQKEHVVAKPSFARLKQQFEDACVSLRAFTLGQRGTTQRGGRAAVESVNGLCERLKKGFASGPHAGEAAALVVTGRTRVAAAEARLALLQGRRVVPVTADKG
jgi:hypothetical protein